MNPNLVPIDLLTRLPGFERATEGQLQRIAQELTLEEVSGRTFLEEGEPAVDLFLLLQGEVEVIMSTPKGNKVVVGVLTPPAILGVAGLMGVGARVASVRARGKVRLLRMDGHRASQLLAADDDVSAVLRRVLLIALASQLARANQLFARLSQASPEWSASLQGVVV